MKFTFLEAAGNQRFAKKITKKDDQTFTVEPYPNILNMTSHAVVTETLEGFKNFLVIAADKGWCLLKGNTKRDLKNESRRGSHDPIAYTSYLAIDFDKVHNITFPKEARLLLGPAFQNVSFIYQPSASAAYRKDGTFSGHLFFLLKTPLHPGQLKAWLMHQNLTNLTLSSQLELTADARGLRYKLDVTTCQNDKLIFIAPPVVSGFDPLVPTDPQQYFELYEDEHEFVDLDLTAINPQAVKEQQKAKIVELRKLAGLPITQAKYKQIKNVEVCTNPAETFVTGIKDQGAFIRLNVNNGDSWAYWHPKNNWEVIHSFKDDMAFLAKEFVPEYYRQCQEDAADYAEQHAETDTGGTRYLAFIDRKTDTYYRGTYEPETLRLELYPTNARDKIDNFLLLHNLPIPDKLPEYDYDFAFDTVAAFNPETGFVNRYSTPDVIIDAASQDFIPDEVPPTIKHIIFHATGGDEETYKHFINWLARLIQHRVPPRTAWILQGTTATGKGLLYHFILTPLIGRDYCGQKRVQDFVNRFNRFNAYHVLELVDEADIDELNNQSASLSASLKNLITEPTVEYEAKGKQKVALNNWCSYIFTSNQPVPVHIEYNDRRFNVAPRQEESIKVPADVVKKINNELQDFARYLLSYEVDEIAAHKPLINEANQKLRRSGLSSLHEIAAALRDGDFAYFADSLSPVLPKAFADKAIAIDYIEVLQYIVEHRHDDKGVCLSREQAEALFLQLDDKTPRKNKFTTMLKRQGINNRVLSDNGAKYRGYRIHFEISDIEAKLFETKAKKLIDQSKIEIVR